MAKQIEKGLTSLEEHTGIRKHSPSKTDAEAQRSPSIGQSLPPRFTPQSSNYGAAEYWQQQDSLYGQQNGYSPALNLNGNRNLSPLESYDYRSASANSFDRAIANGYSNHQPMSIENHHPQPSFGPSNGHGQANDTRLMNGLYVNSGVSSDPEFQNDDAHGPDGNSWYQYTQGLPAANVLLQLNGRSENGGAGAFADIAEADGYEGNMTGGGNQAWPMVILAPQADGTT